MKDIFRRIFKVHSPTKEWMHIYADDLVKTHSALETLKEAIKDKKATKVDLTNAIEQAIGYLGEVLEDGRL